MKLVIINLLIIIAGITGWTISSMHSSAISNLESSIYLVKNGGVDMSNKGQRVIGIAQLKDFLETAHLRETYKVHDVRVSTVLLAKNAKRIFEAYGVSGSIYTTGKASSIDALPIEISKPEMGLNSVGISGKISSINMIDAIDSTRSVLRKVPELYLSKVKFTDIGFTISGVVVGK